MLRARLVASAIVAVWCGALAGLFMVYVAWQHNPQQEFHGEGGVNWSGLGLIGSSWFVVVAGGVFLASACVLLAARWLCGSHSR